MEGKTVFLLEDDLILLSCVKTILRDEGYQVLTATGVREARRILHEAHPDLFILDLFLPDGSGLDLLKEIRLEGRHAAPALILTGASSPENFRESFLSEADQYIQKPVSILTLLVLIERLLAQSYREKMVFSADRVTHLRPLSYLAHLMEEEPRHPHRFLVTVDVSDVLEREEEIGEVQADALLKTLLYQFLFAFEKAIDPGQIEAVVTETGSDLVVSVLWEMSKERELNEILERTSREVERETWAHPIPILRPVNVKCVPFQLVGKDHAGRAMHQALRRARTLQRITLSEMRMVSYVQGIVAGPTGLRVGYEMLNRPERHLGTDYVYRTLEKYRMTAHVEMQNIDAACALLMRIPSEAFLSINISAESLLHEGFIRHLYSSLGSQAYRVFLEFTERSPLLETSPILEKIAALRNLGFGIALDDVGAGFNNILSLVKVRPNMIKVDKTLIQGVARDTYRSEAVRAILQLARKMNALVCAEGVENREDLEALLFMKVDLIQGFLFHVPELAEAAFSNSGGSEEAIQRAGASL